MSDARKEKAAALPQTPGVYIMRNDRGKVIYVGKAKKLRNRVYQYFAKNDHPRKVANMVANARDFEVILTDTELEALVLENNLIKKYKPKYNILLKDDKGYPFIRLDLREPYPRMEVAARKGKDGARYFGPYGGRNTAHMAIDIIGEALRLPACGKVFPRDVGKGRPCFRREIGRCDAPCSGALSGEEFHRRMEQAEKLLLGRDRELVESLTEEMTAAAREQAYERAAALRDRIRAIRSLEEKQKIIGAGGMDHTDVVGLCVSPGGSGFAVLHYWGGDLGEKDFLEAPAASEEEAGELMGEFLARYYDEDRPPPHAVLTCVPPEGEELLRTRLADLAGRNVELSVPERGKRRALCAMACQNALDEVSRRAGAARRSGKSLTELAKLLGLASPPRRIESFDISNSGDVAIVAGMVVLKDGRPARSEYRKFHLRTVTEQNDPEAMREVLTRRFSDLREGKSGFADAPDLLLMDGGREQTAVAEQVLASLGISLPVFGMVKDDKHRTRALCDSEGREMSLSAPGLYAMVAALQEEVHRYAVTFHRQTRDKRMRASALDGIPGVGPARKKDLLRTFGSLRGVREASVEQLAQAVPQSVAAAVYAKLHERKDTLCE